jgi:molecular chaperone GrpE
MILGMLKAVLEDEGVKDFCSIGERFDPTKHEAVYAVDSGDVPADMVIDEIEKGYMMKDRLLRPARVTVSRGTSADPGEEDAPVSGGTDTGGGE